MVFPTSGPIFQLARFIYGPVVHGECSAHGPNAFMVPGLGDEPEGGIKSRQWLNCVVDPTLRRNSLYGLPRQVLTASQAVQLGWLWLGSRSRWVGLPGEGCPQAQGRRGTVSRHCTPPTGRLKSASGEPTVSGYSPPLGACGFHQERCTLALLLLYKKKKLSRRKISVREQLEPVRRWTCPAERLGGHSAFRNGSETFREEGTWESGGRLAPARRCN